MIAKSNQNITEQRLELISSAIGKLEIALTKFYDKINLGVPSEHRIYDFSNRQKILNEARNQQLVKETSDEPAFYRAYENPEAIIEAIEDEKYQLAARIQYEGGARLEAVQRIDIYMTIKTSKLTDNNLKDIDNKIIDKIYSKVNQMQGIKLDTFAKVEKGQLLTIEKGGKPGIVQISILSYQKLQNFLQNDGVFSININHYRRALRHQWQLVKLTMEVMDLDGILRRRDLKSYKYLVI